MTPYEIVEQKIKNEMVKGQRHAERRDMGRLAGGYAAAGHLNALDLARLEDLVAAKSDTPKRARADWRDAVEFGRKEPVRHEKRHTHAPANQGFDWNDPIFIGKEAEAALDPRCVDAVEIPQPAPDWQPGDMIRYLESVFDPDEKVGIVATAWKKEDGKHVPNRGVWDRTRAELVDELRKKAHDIGSVIGDIQEFGVWVRINPLDGDGCKDINVTSFRHALIEADDQDLGHQLALIQELNLPCSAIVHSGGKSIHAVVKVDAADAADYKRRVDRLYEVCEKSGLKVDNANRNPSRLSRLPGVIRNGSPQYLIDGRCGAKTFDDWLTSIEELHDKLPDIESLADVWDNLPDLEPEVIKGLVRKGHKMLLAGPSKAAKSFDLLELSIAIAEGLPWHGWDCTQGAVLYVNLELSRPSALHRLKGVYQALGIPPRNINKIDIWNLRGNAVPLDKLAPKLIRRAMAKGYIAIIIDPIYKVLTGDENSAEQMALFCNQFDRIATALGAATIYAHHHSKGSQGQKRSIDRSSGSGVFSRDPDAILDLIELDISKDRREVLFNHAAKATLEGFADAQGLDISSIPEEQRQPHQAFLMAFQTLYPARGFDLSVHLSNAFEAVSRMTGWRIECNLREFATPPPRRTWFRYPIHIEDTHDLLIDAKAAGEEAPWEADRRSKEEARKAKAEAKKDELEEAIEAAGGPGKATVTNVAEEMGVTNRTVQRQIERSKQWDTAHGLIIEREAK